MALLLAPTTGVGDRSAWILVEDKPYVCLEVAGIVAGDIVQVQGSVLSPPPKPTADGIQFGVDITSDGLYTQPEGPKWIRVILTAGAGGGTVSVNWTYKKP